MDLLHAERHWPSEQPLRCEEGGWGYVVVVLCKLLSGSSYRLRATSYSVASTNLKGFCDSLSSPLLAMEAIMAAKEISVKKYVVRLSAEERQQLEAMIRKGKGPARRLLKARILLKADVSD